MNNYLIPANSKKSQLIANLFHPIDLVIVSIGLVTTLLLALIIKYDTIPILVIKLLPAGIGILLVTPVPNYHNVLVFLRELYTFYTEKRQYKWRGWCASYEFGEKD